MGLSTPATSTAVLAPTSLTLPTTAPLSAPGAPTIAVGAAGLPNGTYTWKVTFVTAFGETTGGTASASQALASERGTLTNIAVGPTGTTARNIYRIKTGGSIYYQVDTLADNVTTTYSDNTADASLSAVIPPVISSAYVLTNGQLYYDSSETDLLLPAGIWTNGTIRVKQIGYIGGNSTQLIIGSDIGFLIVGDYDNASSPSIVGTSPLDPSPRSLKFSTGASETLGLRLFGDGKVSLPAIPTTTDPDVQGELFTCTAAELGALLAAGAKHVLYSKHA